MILLGIDLETTGLDKDKCSVIEVGVVLWDTDRKKTLSLHDWLISGVEVPKEITTLTGIHQTDLDMLGRKHHEVFEDLFELMQMCDYVVAHNGRLFDEPFLIAEVERCGLIHKMPHKPWIDTSIDVPYPDSMMTRKLTYLGAEHGYVNTNQHRAVFDVLTMFEVLKHYDIVDVCARAKSPTLTIKAGVSYDTRDKAKERGYRWHAEEKEWRKSIKELDLDEEIKKSPFNVTIIEER